MKTNPQAGLGAKPKEKIRGRVEKKPCPGGGVWYNLVVMAVNSIIRSLLSVEIGLLLLLRPRGA